MTEYLYRPTYGANGTVECGLFDSGLASANTELTCAHAHILTTHYSDPTVAAGDIPYRDASASIAKLPVGSINQFIAVISSGGTLIPDYTSNLYAITLTATTVSGATTMTTTNLTATTTSGTTLFETQIYTNVLTATNISGATNIIGVTLSGTTLIGSTIKATSLTATTLTATNLSAGNAEIYHMTITGPASFSIRHTLGSDTASSTRSVVITATSDATTYVTAGIFTCPMCSVCLVDVKATCMASAGTYAGSGAGSYWLTGTVWASGDASPVTLLVVPTKTATSSAVSACNINLSGGTGCFAVVVNGAVGCNFTWVCDVTRVYVTAHI